MSRLHDLHRRRLEQFVAECENLAGTYTRMAQQASQVLVNGGQVQCQPQIQYCTGGHARVLKDLGVIEHFQSEGINAKRIFPHGGKA